MEHPCPTGKTRDESLLTKPKWSALCICVSAEACSLSHILSRVAWYKMIKAVCFGGFWKQPLKAPNLPSGPLKRSLLSVEHQLCDIICRMGAEKVYMLVSKKTPVHPTIGIRPKLSLLAEIIIMMSALRSIQMKMIFLLSRCGICREQLTPISSLYFRRLDGGMCSALSQTLATCWYREHDVMLKEAVLVIQQNLPGSKCHLSQGKKTKQPRER